MRHQDAETIIRIPRVDVERWLARIEVWPLFLIGVTSVERLGHERYRFELADGRDRRTVIVCVRHRPATGTFTWRALEGPSFTGRLRLESIDEEHTAVRLGISSHPSSLTAGLAEMLLPRLHRAAHDLRNLEQQVVAPQRRFPRLTG